MSKAHKGRIISEETLKKMLIAAKKRSGEKSNLWRGGKTSNYGYVLIASPNHPHKNAEGYVREHRLIMEKHLGRFLYPKEVVHHLNGNKSDNRIENLVMCSTESEHQKLHRKQYCKRGHLRIDDNLYLYPHGGRICKICCKYRGAKSRLALKQKENLK